jgi:hypothetical protein
MSVFKRLFSATLNCAFSFITLLRLDVILLKSLMPALYALLWKHDVSTWSMWRWCLFFVLTLHSWVNLKIFMVIYSKLINENMYAHGRGEIYNFYRLLHEFLGLTPDMIITVFFVI